MKRFEEIGWGPLMPGRRAEVEGAKEHACGEGLADDHPGLFKVD